MSLKTTIALALLHDRAVLGLKTRRLAADVMRRFGVKYETALSAIALARENQGGLK